MCECKRSPDSAYSVDTRMVRDQSLLHYSKSAKLNMFSNNPFAVIFFLSSNTWTQPTLVSISVGASCGSIQSPPTSIEPTTTLSSYTNTIYVINWSVPLALALQSITLVWHTRPWDLMHQHNQPTTRTRHLVSSAESGTAIIAMHSTGILFQNVKHQHNKQPTTSYRYGPACWRGLHDEASEDRRESVTWPRWSTESIPSITQMSLSSPFRNQVSSFITPRWKESLDRSWQVERTDAKILTSREAIQERLEVMSGTALRSTAEAGLPPVP